MTNLFRHIRQQLADDNQFLKYSRYAIGEIVLVVIGILIALSINNYNDKRKDAAAEQLYYGRILNDLDLDKQLIAELLEKADHRIANSKALLLDLDSGTKDKHYLTNKFLEAIRNDAYIPRNTTFKDLTSSGSFKLLNDLEIKNSLIQFYGELENKQAQMNQNRNKLVDQTFDLIGSSMEFGGLQEFDYVKQLLNQEIIQTLPQVDWTRDKSSESYQKFQLMLLMNIALADREKQHLYAIRDIMEVPYSLLEKKCEKPSHQQKF